MRKIFIVLLFCLAANLSFADQEIWVTSGSINKSAGKDTYVVPPNESKVDGSYRQLTDMFKDNSQPKMSKYERRKHKSKLFVSQNPDLKKADKFKEYLQGGWIIDAHNVYIYTFYDNDRCFFKSELKREDRKENEEYKSDLSTSKVEYGDNFITIFTNDKTYKENISEKLLLSENEFCLNSKHGACYQRNIMEKPEYKDNQIIW